MKRAVIFDMDGVLVDSEPIYINSFRQFLGQNNITLNEEQIGKIAGASSTQIWRYLSKLWNNPIEPADLRKLYHETQPKVKLPYKDILFPGVVNVLSILKEKGLVLALASSSSMKAIHTMLNDTETISFFSYIVSGEMFIESKPNPEIYLNTLRLLELDSSDCLAVEDSTYGIQAAKSAGIDTAAILDTRFYYNQSLADHVIRDISSLIKLECLST